MIKIFICLFVGFVFGYILGIREEKHERKMKELDNHSLDEIAYQATELFLGVENKDRALL